MQIINNSLVFVNMLTRLANRPQKMRHGQKLNDKFVTQKCNLQMQIFSKWVNQWMGERMDVLPWHVRLLQPRLTCRDRSSDSSHVLLHLAITPAENPDNADGSEVM